MTKREFATLLFRLLGLYFIGLSLEFVPAMIQQWAIYRSGNLPFIYFGLLYSMLMAGSPFILLSGFGFALFILAPGFSVGVFKREQPLEISQELANLRAAAFIMAGTILVGQAIPDLITAFVHYSSSYSARLPRNMTLPFAQVIKLIFGIYLMNCGGWRFIPPHRWGRDPEWPDKE